VCLGSFGGVPGERYGVRKRHCIESIGSWLFHCDSQAHHVLAASAVSPLRRASRIKEGVNEPPQICSCGVLGMLHGLGAIANPFPFLVSTAKNDVAPCDLSISHTTPENRRQANGKNPKSWDYSAPVPTRLTCNPVARSVITA
jgi:hypothetical protein